MWIVALSGVSVGLAWLLLRRAPTSRGDEGTPAVDATPAVEQNDEVAQQTDGPQLPSVPVPSEDVRMRPTPSDQEVLPTGIRVQLHGLKSAADLNGAYGVIYRYDAHTGRYAVRKEVARAQEAPNVTVRAANLRSAPRFESLAELQHLVDSVPVGAKVTLPRGVVRGGGGSGGDDGAGTKAGAKAPPTLVLKHAITLSGMGNRAGGTRFEFPVRISDDAAGELLDLSGVDISGSLDISPRDIARVRLSKVSITGAADEPALFLDEISTKVPHSSDAEGRVLLEDCWVRGGSVGIWINAVGCLLRRCRVKGATTYGIQSNANFSIEACTIGECGKSGRGGGVLTRAGVTQIRAANGINENKVQREWYDKVYSGIDCRGCVGQCTCSALFTIGALAGKGGFGNLIQWGDKGKGQWQSL